MTVTGPEGVRDGPPARAAPGREFFFGGVVNGTCHVTPHIVTCERRPATSVHAFRVGGRGGGGRRGARSALMGEVRCWREHSIGSRHTCRACWAWEVNALVRMMDQAATCRGGQGHELQGRYQPPQRRRHTSYHHTRVARAGTGRRVVLQRTRQPSMEYWPGSSGLPHSTTRCGRPVGSSTRLRAGVLKGLEAADAAAAEVPESEVGAEPAVCGCCCCWPAAASLTREAEEPEGDTAGGVDPAPVCVCESAGPAKRKPTVTARFRCCCVGNAKDCQRESVRGQVVWWPERGVQGVGAHRPRKCTHAVAGRACSPAAAVTGPWPAVLPVPPRYLTFSCSKSTYVRGLVAKSS